MTDYMVITNNYRTYERGRRGEEEEGLRRRRSRAGRDAANKPPEPLSGVSRVCRHQRVVSFDFHMVIIESGEGVVVRDAGHLPARKSPLGHGAAADDAARCVKGLTTMRSASTKWSTACPAVRFSISIMNLVAHRPATDEANETLAACGAHGRQGGVAHSASRAELREVSR